MSKCKICSQIFNVHKEPDLEFCSKKCERDGDKVWKYWKDTVTKQKYEIDFDTSAGMSLANDTSKDLIRISEAEFRN